MPDGPRTLLGSLGWDLPPGVDDIGLATLDIGDVGQRLTAWNDLAADPEADEGDEAAALAELALSVGRAIVDLSEVELTAPQDYLDRTGIVDEFLPRLVELYLLQSAASPPGRRSTSPSCWGCSSCAASPPTRRGSRSRTCGTSCTGSAWRRWSPRPPT